MIVCAVRFCLEDIDLVCLLLLLLLLCVADTISSGSSGVIMTGKKSSIFGMWDWTEMLRLVIASISAKINCVEATSAFSSRMHALLANCINKFDSLVTFSNVASMGLSHIM